MFNWVKDLFSSNKNDLTLDHFQLEGLVRNLVPFLLIDLREGNTPELSDKVKRLMRDAKLVSPKDVENYLRENKIPESQPIVLACRKGKTSRKVARRLAKGQWLNAYSLEGGVEQLERELNPKT